MLFRILLGIIGLQLAAFGQSVSLSIGSGSGTAGGSVSLPIDLSSFGGAQPGGLQWALSYSAADITSISVAAGGSTTSAGKTLNCSGGSCLVFGFNTTVIPDGTVAVATFQIAANPSSSNISVQLSGVVGSNTTGTVTYPGSGNIGTISLPVAVGLSGLSCTTTTINTPGSTPCTVSLTGAAPAGGFLVPLSSNSGSVTVPGSVTVGAGQTTANFTATAAQVGSNQSAIVTAGSGVTRTVTLSLIAPVRPSALSCTPSSVNAPGTAACTVTLTAAAPGGGSVVALTSNGSVTVPASVTVGAGQTSAGFTANVGAVVTDQAALLTATLNGTTVNFTLTAVAPAPAQLSSISCNPSTLGSSASSTCTATLNKAAGSNLVVGLSSSSGTLTVPASVVIGTGASSANFTATTGIVNSAQSVTVSGTLNGVTQTATLSLTVTVQPSGLSCTPSSVNSPGTAACTVTLTAAAPGGGSVVALTSNGSVTVPASVTVGAGQTSAGFTATVGAVVTNQASLLTATLNGATVNFTLTAVAPAQLSSISCNPSTLGSSASSTCTATLNKAAGSNLVVGLSSSSGTLTVPASVVIGTGATSANFTATTGIVNSAQSVTVSGTLNGVTQSTTVSLTVTVQPSGLNCTPSSVISPGSASCTVTLTAAAPGGGSVVALTSNGSVTVPASVTVGAGQTSAGFTATVGAVVTDQAALLTATLNGATVNFTLTAVAPAAPAQLSQISCNPSTLGSSASSTCTATLNKAAGSNLVVGLSSSSGTLTVPASVVIGTGASSANFTATTGIVNSAQSVTVSGTLNGVTQSATLSLTVTIQPSGLSCTPSSVNSPGTAACTVTLTAAAPGGGSVVALTSNGSVTVPASVTVGAGQTSVGFTATVGAVLTDQAALITATLNGATVNFTLTALAPAQLSSISCNPSTLGSSASSTCTAALNKAAGSNLVVALSSTSGTLTVPASVTILTGASSANFTAATGIVNSAQSVTVSGTLNAVTRSATVNLTVSLQLSGLSCTPSSVISPGSAPCTVTLTAPAPGGGALVALTSNGSVTVPASVTVGAGQTSAGFTATVGAVVTDQVALLTANYNGASVNFLLTALAQAAPAQLSSISCNPSTLGSSVSSTCTATLNKAAGSNLVVALSSSSGTLTVPANVVIGTGASSANFTATAGIVNAAQSVTVSGTLNGVTQSATLSLTVTVQPSGLSCAPGSVNSPGTTACTVTLTAAAPGGGSVVALTSNGSVTVPATVTVGAGQSSAGFTATVGAVVTDQVALLTATLNGTTVNFILTAIAPAAAQLSSISCSPSSLGSSASSTCTATLNKAAGSNLVVGLSSSSVTLTVPGSVSIGSGASSANFTATAGIVNSPQSVTVSGTLNAVTRSTTLSLTASVQPSGLNCTPSSVNSPGTASCTVTLAAPAPGGGSVVALTSNGSVTVPANVTVGAGQSSAGFTANVASVVTDQVALITASLNGASVNFFLTAIAPAQLSSLSCSPSTLGAGQSSSCSVVLNAAAASNIVVSLSSNLGNLTVPSSVVVGAGTNSANFTATAGAVNLDQSATVTASANGVSRTASINLAAANQLSSLSCAPASLQTGGAATCTVTLTGPAGLNTTVSLSSNLGNLSVPSSVAIGAGASSANFTASAGVVSSDQTATVTATANGISKTTAINLVSVRQLSGLSCSPSSLGAGQAAICTATLNGPAGSNLLVSLASNLANLTVTGGVVIGAGATSGNFTVTAGAVNADQTATVTATLNGISQTAAVNLIAAANQLSGLTCSPASLGTGQTANCSVTLTGPAGSNFVVSLASDLGNLTVPASVTIGAGASSANFTATAGAINVAQTATVTASANGVAKTDTIDLIAANQLSGLSCSPASLGAGQAATCTVTLTGAAALNLVVGLSSNQGNLTVPASVAIGAGLNSASFLATAGAVGVDQTATVTATANGISKTASVNLVAATQLSGLTCSPVILAAGETANCTVTLTGPASNNVLVSLTSNLNNLTLPANIAIGAGSASANFTATAGAVNADQTATITAASNGVSKTASINLIAATQLSGLNCSPVSLGAGQTATCTITLTGPAGSNIVVNLSSSLGNLTVPASVPIGAGVTSANFLATAGAVGADQTATVTASANGISKTASINLVAAIQLSTLTCTPGILGAGEAANCTVTLTGPVGNNVVVNLSSSLGNLTVPSTVAINAGATSANFAAMAGVILTNQTATVTASWNGQSKSQNIGLIAAVTLSDLSCSPAKVNTPGSASCTVSLSGVAPAGGITIALSGSIAGVATPNSVTVPQGAANANFLVTVAAVNSNQSAEVRATSNGVLKVFTLDLVAPVRETSLSCTPATLGSGQSATCLLTLSASVASQTTVNLSASSNTLSVPGTVLINAGASSATFTATAANVQSDQTVTVSATWTGQGPGPVAFQFSLLTSTNSPQVTSLVCTPATLAVLQIGSCVAQLNRPPNGIVNVSIAQTSDRLIAPPEVTVSAGSTVANFEIKASVAGTSQAVVLTASIGSTSAQASVFLLAADAPQITAPPSVLVAVATPIQLNVSVSDPNNLQVNLTAQGLPQGATFDALTRQVSWVPTESQIGAYTVTFSAVNSAGVTAARSVAIQVATKPTLLGTRNAANPVSSEFCSAGSWVTIFGTGFTSQNPAAAQTSPLPTVLAGIQVLGNGAPLPLLFASATQINLQCPSLAVGSLVQLVVRAESGLTIGPIATSIAAATPAIFTLDSSGSGQGAVLISGSGLIAMPVTSGIPSRPAAKGEFIEIFANGLGVTDEEVPAGSPAPTDHLVNLKNKVRAYLGGIECEVSFSGRTPGSIGLYQINAAVPQGVASGSALPLYVEVVVSDGTILKSNVVTIAVE